MQPQRQSGSRHLTCQIDDSAVRLLDPGSTAGEPSDFRTQSRAMAVCAHCGQTNDDDARFCSRCGARLIETTASHERKLITALFCDIVGSTALGERLDPEDLERLLDVYSSITRRHIEAHGGVLEKFIGDAAVGVFGVPLAHEDDASRAIRAAKGIIDEIVDPGVGLEVRIGINTGCPVSQHRDRMCRSIVDGRHDACGW